MANPILTGSVGLLSVVIPSSTTLQPEERLMVEVLKCAYADLSVRARGQEADRIRAAVRRWIASEDDVWPMSFVRICRHFGVDLCAARAASNIVGEPASSADDRFAHCG